MPGDPMHDLSRRTIRFSLVGMVALLALTSTESAAQKSLIAGVGAGTGVGPRGADSGLKGTVHGMAFVEAHLPLLPVGVRVDAMLLDASKGTGPAAVSADGVFVVPIPAVQPYALAGWGRYGVGHTLPISGWNYGLGVRLVTGPLHVFGEMRRHQRVSRDLFTVGITL